MREIVKQLARQYGIPDSWARLIILNIFLDKQLRCFFSGEKAYTCRSEKRGKKWILMDKTDDMRTQLKNANIPFEEGNDAPKGGKNGIHFRIVVDETVVKKAPRLVVHAKDPDLIAKYSATIDAIKTGVI